ncbi:MAG: hypothetical protein K0R39_1479 [Symbiobacteriaceae bacterium]|jgi:hypothetical protein|nr:hypothetical protein [Symbiobacteriaceae bacterium]
MHQALTRPRIITLSLTISLPALLLALIFLTLTPGVAYAHSPIFLRPGAEPAPITDAEKSWAIYGRLAPGTAYDLIPVEAGEGEKLKLQLLVPKRDDLAQYRPRVALIGPGLRGTLPPGAPVSPGAGEGALLLPEPAAPSEFYEPFTQTRYWTYGETTGTFPAAGRYRIVVYDPAGKGGPYTVALGEREDFGPADLLGFPATWLKVKTWFRR